MVITCTKEKPWDNIKRPDTRIIHHNAAEVANSQENGYPGGDLVTMSCPNCGCTWMKELPQ